MSGSLRADGKPMRFLESVIHMARVSLAFGWRRESDFSAKFFFSLRRLCNALPEIGQRPGVVDGGVIASSSCKVVTSGSPSRSVTGDHFRSGDICLRSHGQVRSRRAALSLG